MTEGPLTRRRRLLAVDGEDEASVLAASECARLEDAGRRIEARRRERLTAEGRRPLAEYMSDDADPSAALRRFMADLEADRTSRWREVPTPERVSRRRETSTEPRTVSERIVAIWDESDRVTP